MESLERILGEHPFLQGMEDSHLNLITGCASNVKFEQGEYLFREGEQADCFYIIRHGKVILETFAPGKESITIQTLGDGDILGWSWLVPPHLWSYDGKALELTRAISLDGKCLREKCEEDHDLGYEIFKRFSLIIVKRLAATRMQLMDVYGTDA
jgi:CRP/FNR family cyclic AMP-dependent transcriptional regulator